MLPRVTDFLKAQGLLWLGEILDALSEDDWSTIRWREGAKGNQVKCFARLRIYRVGHRGKHLPT